MGSCRSFACHWVMVGEQAMISFIVFGRLWAIASMVARDASVAGGMFSWFAVFAHSLRNVSEPAGFGWGCLAFLCSGRSDSGVWPAFCNALVMALSRLPVQCRGSFGPSSRGVSGCIAAH